MTGQQPTPQDPDAVAAAPSEQTAADVASTLAAPAGSTPSADAVPSSAVPGDERPDAAVPPEEESEIAADYLEELLDIADLDGDIEIEVHQNRTFLSVVAEGEQAQELKILVGEHGEVLDSLQELVRLSVLAATGNRSRLILDIAGHRERRRETLRELAGKAVQTVRESGQPHHMEPLSPYERKLVHDFVAELGFVSESEDEGPKRHIVITGPAEGSGDRDAETQAVAGVGPGSAAGSEDEDALEASAAEPVDPAEVQVDFTAPGEAAPRGPEEPADGQSA